jgi:hypothetical protein
MLGQAGELGVAARPCKDLRVTGGKDSPPFAFEGTSDNPGATRPATGLDDLVNERDQLVGQPDRDLLAHPEMVPNWYRYGMA